MYMILIGQFITCFHFILLQYRNIIIIKHSCSVVCWIGPGAGVWKPVFRQVPRHLIILVHQKVFCSVDKGVQWQVKYACLNK